MWQGKAASKLHTHKRVAGGHPHLSPPSPCQRRARCPAAAAHRWLCQMREQWGATGPGPTIRGQAPLSPVWQVGWHSEAHSWGEGWGGSGNICKWGGVKKKTKEKRETQQLSCSSATCPSLETCRAEAAGAGLGKASQAPLSSSTHHVGHSSMASSLLRNPCWVRGRDHASPSPSKGKGALKTLLKELQAVAVSLGQPVTSTKAHWQHNYKRAGVPLSQLEGREREKHEFKPISPERGMS